MNQFLSLYERYVPLTEEKPIPTLAETRDRAIAENGELRQREAELRAALENCHALLCAIGLWLEVGPGRILAPDTTGLMVADLRKGADQARALLTKVSR